MPLIPAKTLHQLSWFMGGAVVTGALALPAHSNRWGCPLVLVAVYVSFITAPTNLTTIQIKKCTQANWDGTRSWASLFSTPPTVDANEESSETALAPAVFAAGVIAPKDHLDAYIDSGGAAATGMTVTLVVREA